MKIALLVNSWDNAEAYWKAWYHFYNLNWDSNIKTTNYFLSQSKCPNYSNFNFLLSNIGDWTDRTRYALQQIDEDYVIMVHDDYWFVKHLDINHFNKIINYFLKYNMNCLKFSYINWRYTLDHIEEKLYKFNNNSKWIFNFQTALWKKEFLYQYLMPNESVWTAEVEVSKQMQYLNHKNYLYEFDWYINAVDKRELTPYGKYLLELNNL